MSKEHFIILLLGLLSIFMFFMYQKLRFDYNKLIDKYAVYTESEETK